MSANGSTSTSTSKRPQPQGQDGIQQPRPQHPTAKKPRLDHNTSLPAYIALETQCAQSDVSLEVDILILDHLAYQTTQAALASRGAPATSTIASLGPNVSMVNDFIALFKNRHATYSWDDELKFRILLLKLAIFFTQRFARNPCTPSLNTLRRLREENARRAKAWLEARKDDGIGHLKLPEEINYPSPADLEQKRAHVLNDLSLPAEDDAYEDAFYGTASCVSLLDILPLFMRVSAARDAMNGTATAITQDLMDLAAELMLQACLEQYLVFGATGPQAMEEAFAWGHIKGADDTDEDLMEMEGRGGGDWDEVNDMFCDPVYETEVDGWKAMRDSCLSLLLPNHTSPGSAAASATSKTADFISHLLSTASNHAISAFETKALSFLSALSLSIPLPVLSQLETKGKLNGMSAEETRQFLRECGVNEGLFLRGFATSGTTG
jgi:hypothetical protein